MEVAPKQQHAGQPEAGKQIGKNQEHLEISHSEAVGKIAAALAKAQGKMTAAKKDAKNDYTHSTYATLESVIDAIREPLAQNEIAHVQIPEASPHPGWIRLRTTLFHSSGEWITGIMDMMPGQREKGGAFKASPDPHSVGSALSYMRRYSLAAMLGIAQADDDGNAGSGKGTSTKSQESGKSSTTKKGPPKKSQPKNSIPHPWTKEHDDKIRRIENYLGHSCGGVEESIKATLKEATNNVYDDVSKIKDPRHADRLFHNLEQYILEVEEAYGNPCEPEPITEGEDDLPWEKGE